MLFKLPKYKRFEYHYRYHDPSRDDLDKRIRFARSEARRTLEGGEEEQPSGSMRGAFRPLHMKRRQRRQAAVRTLVILVALCALAWILLTAL